MGAPLPEMEPVENSSAEALLDSLKTIDPGERRKHASVFNYWLSIRGQRQFPPIRDLDPLEISDAGPWSILLEMIGGGEDATVRHFGQAIRGDLQVDKIGDAPNPSLLSCIHAKLPIVAACREAFAFEESYETGDGPRRCWVTLLPFSQTGSWIDYVYGYVSLDGESAEGEAVVGAVESSPEGAEAELEVSEVVHEPTAIEEPDEETIDEPEGEAVAELPEAVEDAPVEEAPEPFQVELKAYDEAEAIESEAEPEPAAEVAEAVEQDAERLEDLGELADQPVEELAEPVEEPGEPVAYDEPNYEEEPAAATKAGFSSKFLGGLASSFYGKVSQAAAPEEEYSEPEAELEPEPVAEAEPEHQPEPEPEPEAAQPIPEPAYAVEGTLQSKLTDVRALAAEAREAQVRSNIALYEGLSAAYDFALDAEAEPEEYLRLVEGQGLKIQLRSPMKPVVKLAFDGMCDEPTIEQLEAVLAWALKHDLPRGTLAERIQEEGGIGQILNGKAA